MNYFITAQNSSQMLFHDVSVYSVNSVRVIHLYIPSIFIFVVFINTKINFLRAFAHLMRKFKLTQQTIWREWCAFERGVPGISILWPQAIKFERGE
jgi:hypothetical protein